MALSTIPTLPVVLPLTSRDLGLADQGNYFTALTPTPGTGIIGFATTTTLVIGEANPYLYLYNAGPATIYPSYLRLNLTVAGAGSGATRFDHTVDVGNKQTTVGTALTINNTNIGSNVASRALISVGINVCNAPSTGRRVLGNQSYRPTIGIVNDVYQFNFGVTTVEPIAPVATLCNFSYSYAQPVIPPGYNWSVVFWSAGTSSGPTFEVELGYFEK
jgi:hypothetical protein